jgi:hypothetical protein
MESLPARYQYGVFQAAKYITTEVSRHEDLSKMAKTLWTKLQKSVKSPSTRNAMSHADILALRLAMETIRDTQFAATPSIDQLCALLKHFAGNSDCFLVH